MKKILFLLFFTFMLPCHALTIKDFYGLNKEVENKGLVKELKANIESYFKVNVKNQVLYLNGIPLNDNQKLSKINNSSIIYLYNKKDNYTYPIKVNKTGLGFLNVLNQAKVGSNIYIHIVPNDNYYLKSIDVIDFEGKKITLDDNRFTMPFGSININVLFEEKTKMALSSNYKKTKQNILLIPGLIFLLSLILSTIIKIKSSKLFKKTYY